MKTKYNVAVVSAALTLLESPGMTVDKLRQMREDQIRVGFADETDQMYYDVILTAIEIMTRPLFQ